MAWTINNGKLYFNSVLYTGNSGTQNITGVGFEPQWVWMKQRNAANSNVVIDSVRGVLKRIRTDQTDAEDTLANSLTAFGSDGFTLGSAQEVNDNSDTYVAWNWLAAGTAPSNTYAVKVVSDSGNKYRFDDFGTSAVTLEISEGGTFTFDQSDSSNNGHPLRFATQADAANSSQYTTGVTTNGTPGQAGAYTRITVAASAPTLFYYCTNHSGMGGQANTPTTNSFSNFAGTIQSNISPNTTSGFSIVSYTGTGVANKTIGHGLGTTPGMIIVKNRSITEEWRVWQQKLGGPTYKLALNDAGAADQGSSVFNGQSATTFTVGTDPSVNGNGNSIIAYCFNDVQGYSKFGSYTGNGNANGTFVYTGFKPAFIMIKETTNSGNWTLYDNKRAGFNSKSTFLYANTNAAEDTSNTIWLDMLSNGFKILESNNLVNRSGGNYIYMTFAENPFTSSAGTPVTAR